MFLDKEEDIIGYLTCELKKTTPLLYNGNSFNKKSASLDNSCSYSWCNNKPARLYASGRNSM